MRSLLAPVLLTAAVFVAGCTSNAVAHTDIAAQHPGLTRRQFEAAIYIANRQLRGANATVKIATAKMRSGTITDSNTGHPCPSGNLLHIEIIGTFPHIVNGGTPGQSGAVHAELIDADAKARRPCLIGVKTGSVHPDPTATTLFTR